MDRSGRRLLNGGRLGAPSGQPRRYDRMASSATSQHSNQSIPGLLFVPMQLHLPDAVLEGLYIEGCTSMIPCMQCQEWQVLRPQNTQGIMMLPMQLRLLEVGWTGLYIEVCSCDLKGRRCFFANAKRSSKAAYCGSMPRFYIKTRNPALWLLGRSII